MGKGVKRVGQGQGNLLELIESASEPTLMDAAMLTCAIMQSFPVFNLGYLPTHLL